MRFELLHNMCVCVCVLQLWVGRASESSGMGCRVWGYVCNKNSLLKFTTPEHKVLYCVSIHIFFLLLLNNCFSHLLQNAFVYNSVCEHYYFGVRSGKGKIAECEIERKKHTEKNKTSNVVKKKIAHNVFSMFASYNF